MKINYFDKKNRLIPHGIMFHHFHYEDDRPYAQGSITSLEFQQIIEHIGVKNILSADIWLEKAINNELREKEVCITFDDSLKCQMDIAYPILEKYNIDAFWFVFSSVFNGKINLLEVYKYFYNMFFPNFETFYSTFKEYFTKSDIGYMYEENYNLFMQSNYLIEFDFYSEKEREFRFYRDRIINDENFKTIMGSIMVDYDIDINIISKNLWMNEEDLKILNSNNQIIGLHSHTHPTNMAQLDIGKQKEEYTSNKEYISSVTCKDPLTVSHPCGSYNNATLKVLNELGIKIGFRSNFEKLSHTTMEFPRVDHSYLMQELNQKRG
tara:strand:+ start:2891 stop:3859 length:969 start_codon:yes stop_codon:yes gene_type:complete